MFEKESEEYVIKKHHIDKTKLPIDFSLRCEFSDDFTDFQKGAEFGYSKANEWHFVKDGDLPKENKLYLVEIKDNGLAIAYFNGLHWETRYSLGDFGHCVETVIAWCEIPTFTDKE